MKGSRHYILMVAAALAVTISALSVAAQDATWDTNATANRGRNSERFVYVCPPNGTPSTSIWGSGLYTDDSSICTAGVHAGVITAHDGGKVMIEIRPGASSYDATSRNGVTTRSYGPWSGSYIVVGVRADVQRKQEITWTTQADSLRGKDGQRFTYLCPAGGTASQRLWGDTVYTDDSSICTAAVHSGLITVKNGGTITIEIMPGMGAYAGSTRYGVTSKSYGSWSGSFVFVK